MSAPVVEPSACRWCAIARRGHGRQFADAVGYHAWVWPSQEQILARMKARRLAAAVAREGALPVPVGPEPQRVCSLCGVVKPDGAAMRDHVRNVHPDEFCGLYHEQPCRHGAVGPEPQALSDADELAAFRALELGDLDGRVSASCGKPNHLTWLRKRDDTRACPWCVMELQNDSLVARTHQLAHYQEIERNFWANRRADESLAAVANRRIAELNARIAELEALTPARVQTCRVCGAGYTYGEPCSSCEFRKRMAAELQARGLDGEHYEAVHHSYRVGHDLPETGGTS